MKKVTIEISDTGLLLENTSQWFMHWLQNIDREDAITVNSTMGTLLENGDIWYVTDKLINDGAGFNMQIIFDSESALNTWETDAKPIFEQMFTVAGEEVNISNLDITFEDFASLAAETEETSFNGLPSDF
jgi:hypothetical protein